MDMDRAVFRCEILYKCETKKFFVLYSLFGKTFSKFKKRKKFQHILTQILDW
jgi:hypothetical protein